MVVFHGFNSRYFKRIWSNFTFAENVNRLLLTFTMNLSQPGLSSANVVCFTQTFLDSNLFLKPGNGRREQEVSKLLGISISLQILSQHWSKCWKIIISMIEEMNRWKRPLFVLCGTDQDAPVIRERTVSMTSDTIVYPFEIEYHSWEICESELSTHFEIHFGYSLRICRSPALNQCTEAFLTAHEICWEDLVEGNGRWLSFDRPYSNG